MEFSTALHYNIDLDEWKFPISLRQERMALLFLESCDSPSKLCDRRSLFGTCPFSRSSTTLDIACLKNTKTKLIQSAVSFKENEIFCT